VFKHALLAQLALAMAKKDKPFFCLDTHAGIGRYDLMHEWAQKNAEYKDGIARIWERADAPPAMSAYLDAVRAENAQGGLQFYPGSPRILRRLMRRGDRLALTELNKKDCATLEELFRGDRQVHVRLLDGYQGLLALLPPPERRGLVLIDSSFDRAHEFDRLIEGFAKAYRKFATGVYALWYPLMEPAAMVAFERAVKATGIRKILQLELAVHDVGWSGYLRGCGMLVVNPPYGFEAAAREILDWIWPALAADSAGGTRVQWLAGE